MNFFILVKTKFINPTNFILIKPKLYINIAEKQAKVPKFNFEVFREIYQNDMNKKDFVNKDYLDLRIKEMCKEIV